MALGVEQQRLASPRRARGPRRRSEQPVEEAGGVRPLDPDEGGAAAHRRARAARRAGARSRSARPAGATAGGLTGWSPCPLVVARSAATRACCSSRSAAERISSTIARRPASSRVSSSSCFGPGGQLEGARDRVGQRRALRGGRQGVVGQVGQGAEARQHPRRPGSGAGSPGSSASGAHAAPRSRAAPPTPRPPRTGSSPWTITFRRPSSKRRTSVSKRVEQPTSAGPVGPAWRITNGRSSSTQSA